MKTALLAVTAVVVAVALIFAGVLLGSAIPGLDSAAQRILGNDGGSGTADDGSGGQLDLALQNEIFEKLKETYYKPVDADTLSRSAIDGMLAGLDDPYTYYYDPDQYASLVEMTAGEYSGVGMVLMMNERLPTVVSVFEASPAAEAGIEPGDIILGVAGSSTEGLTLTQVVTDIKGEEGSQVQLDMYRPVTPLSTTTTLTTADEDNDAATDAADAEKAAETETVDLTQVPEGGSEKAYTLTRRTIVVPTTTTEITDDQGKKVAHIVLSTFASEKAAAELRAVVETAIYDDKVDAIILDIRGNGGGLLNQAVEVASIFINSGVIVSTEGLHYPEERLQATGNAVPDVPLYLLVDGYSASASEILAGALQDYSRAVLVGETTFGKGLVQNIEPLSNGGAVKVTIAVYLTPKGRDINQTGITPDVIAPDDPATEDVDETLEEALDLIAAGD